MSAQRLRTLFFGFAMLSTLAAASLAHAGGIVDEEVNGGVVEARIVLNGTEFAELKVEFEEVAGLDVGTLGLSAEHLGPLDLVAVRSRLPQGVMISAGTGLPVLLRFEPVPGLGMRGMLVVELHTELLPHTAGTPLRLFAAPMGGSFQDITAATGAGSYRVGGARPETLSTEYVIAADLRTHRPVGESKLDRLDDILVTRGSLLTPTVLAELEGLSEDARAAFDEQDYPAALGYVDALVAAVMEGSGATIPDTFEVGGSDVNVAGELRSAAATLRYTVMRLDQGQ